jgi:hypothetical protein
MTQEHPITPPPELVEQWVKQMLTPQGAHIAMSFDWVATQAARWGADQELEACCEWADATGWEGAGDPYRAARRPKPPSLKEQALQALEEVDDTFDINEVHHETIRRALEQLDD